MSKSLAASAHIPPIDLAMLKDTIAYMHDDVRRVHGLEGLAQALDSVLIEIDTAQSKIAARPAPRIAAARFLPVWR